MVLQRIISFGLIVAVGFLMLVSLVLTAAITALGDYLQLRIPLVPIVWQGLNLGFTLVVVTLLFAMVYKVLPNVELDWRDVWVGALVTAVLFSIGKFLIGLYLGRSAFASSYGAAGSIVVLLAWIYYTSQIVLLGAEYTKAYAVQRSKRRGTAGARAGTAAAAVTGATA
jgi:membrane protein